MTDSLIPSQTQNTSPGSLKTDSKTRIKRQTEKIKEIDAKIEDGKIVAGGEEYVIDNHQDFNVALGMCQAEEIEAMEVSLDFFARISHGKETPFIIYGNPAVKVFPAGKMEKGLKILQLSRDKYLDLLGKRAREKEAKRKALEDEISSLDD